MNASVNTLAASLSARLLEMLGHVPTAGQVKAAQALQRLLATEREHATLVLKGYAGTGKTTLVGALVKVLAKERRKVILLAPTGRAAKVLSAYSQANASTIHRRIYRVSGDEDGGSGGMSLAPNRDTDALFVVDEASMIGEGGGEGPFGSRDLLSDLFQHVFSAPGCKLLLIGDPAQLPPVGSDHSPALEVKDLAERGLLAGSIELTEVVRQAEASGILVNATALRDTLASMPPGDPAASSSISDAPKVIPQFILGFDDVIRVDGYDLQDALEDAYAQHGDEEVCVICRSNKRAYQYSQQVRARIHGFEDELVANDRLMVVKNNYFWAAQDNEGKGAALIANGEQVVVRRVHGIEERYGLRFADVTIDWWDGRADRELDVKVIVDVLSAEGPALPGPTMRALARSVMDGITATSKGERYRLFKQDPYANALQVKYAYAVTCHKAQGGQWRTVFVDQGYVTEEMIDREYVRWLYTAVTRASERLYLLNFHPRFFGEGEE